MADERSRPDVSRRRERRKRHQRRIDPRRLVIIDETWMKTNMAPLRGWAPRGARLPGGAPFGHWNLHVHRRPPARPDRRALGLRRPGQRRHLRTYVEKVAPTLSPGDVVVMYNLGSHKSIAVRRTIRDAGAHLLFLPPYSPDLNSIEQAFAKLKHWLRQAAPRSRQTLWQTVGDILEKVTRQECSNYLINAGYASV